MTDNQQTQPQSVAKADTKEMSAREVILSLKSLVRYFLKKWVIIVLFLIAGLVLGAVYSSVKATRYQAESTFVLDEGGGKSTMSSLSALGLDLGSSSAGLFTAAKNIIWLYTSRPMLQATLLKEVDYKGKKRLLIDLYLDESDLRKTLKKDPRFNKIKFSPDSTRNEELSPEQSAVMGWCAMGIKGGYLKVTEVKNTENIITVSFTSQDELFSKTFTEELVKTVNNYYINTKTKKTVEEIEVLQKKADSMQTMMNQSMYQAASALDAEPYANPNMQVLRVPPQKKQVDVQVKSALYVELMKNLEARKMSLAQETPLIQVVDAPVLPLTVIKPSLVKMMIVMGVLTMIIVLSVLTFCFWYNKIMKPTDN